MGQRDQCKKEEKAEEMAEGAAGANQRAEAEEAVAAGAVEEPE